MDQKKQWNDCFIDKFVFTKMRAMKQQDTITNKFIWKSQYLCLMFCLEN